MERRIHISARYHDDRPSRGASFAASNAARPTAPPGSTTSWCRSQAKRIAPLDFRLADRQRLGAAVSQDDEGDRRNARSLEGVAQGWRGVGRHRHDLARSSERAMSSQPSGSTIDDLGFRAGERDPRGKTAAAARHDDPRRRFGDLFEDFEADRPLSGDDHRVVEARHDRRAGLTGDPRGDGFAALGRRS